MSPRAVLDGQHTRAACPLVWPRRWALLHLRHGHVHDADPHVTAMFRRRTRDNGTSGTPGGGKTPRVMGWPRIIRMPDLEWAADLARTSF